MPELDTAARDRLAKDQFAYVDRTVERHLPIHDEAHVRNAIARWNQTDFESKRAKEQARLRMLAAAQRQGIHVAQDDAIAKPTRTTRARS